MDPIAQRVALAWRVARRFRADQAPGQRKHVRDLTQPINKTKGVDREILKEHGESKTEGEETVTPQRRDILPKDVFTPQPKDVGVRDFAESGQDLSNAIKNQIPKDKGYETVKNLSQYLIRTEGGGEGGPEGKKT